MVAIASVVARSASLICRCEERQRRGNPDAWANGRRGWAGGGAPRVAINEIAALRSQVQVGNARGGYSISGCEERLINLSLRGASATRQSRCLSERPPGLGGGRSAARCDRRDCREWLAMTGGDARGDYSISHCEARPFNLSLRGAPATRQSRRLGERPLGRGRRTRRCVAVDEIAALPLAMTGWEGSRWTSGEGLVVTIASVMGEARFPLTCHCEER